MATNLVGILNCTPDSFSDGRGDISLTRLTNLARQLIDDGADILDIGGDSTRPGSICPGIEEEWRRISPLVSRFAQHVPISVDTHHPEVARRAIDSGAAFINDVSGQRAPEMLDVVVSGRASYICMCNPHGGPHTFGDGFTLESALAGISSWITETVQLCRNAGLESQRLIVDPGMGAFISSDPRVSWLIVESLGRLPATEGGILVGCSRKGFLKLLGDLDLEAKDTMSARIGAAAVRQVANHLTTYLRVHNVARQREVLSNGEIAMPEWRDTLK
jgi:dihydropteroate synthase